MRTFQALKDFESPELKSVYCAGLTYTVHANNKYLNNLGEVWALEGKIKWLHTPLVSGMSGEGEVSGPVSFWRRLLSWL
jgi:hypothetical protein